MKDDFFDWLNDCPVQWFLEGEDSDGRKYFFKDNEREIEDEEEFCDNCGTNINEDEYKKGKGLCQDCIKTIN